LVDRFTTRGIFLVRRTDRVRWTKGGEKERKAGRKAYTKGNRKEGTRGERERMEKKEKADRRLF